MGYDAYGRAVIGIKIDPDKLMTKGPVLGCLAEEGEVNPKCPIKGLKTDAKLPKFCAECGEKPFVTDEKPIEGYDRDNSTLCGFTLRTPEPEGYPSLVVGIDAGRARSGDNLSFIPMPTPYEIDTVKHKLKVALEPLGLWDEKRFGLYSVLEESC